MGNEVGRQIFTPLGIRAIAYTTGNIEANEIQHLAECMMSASRLSGNVGKLSRSEFEDVLKGIEKFESTDTELLTSIFTMFDVSGEGIIVVKEFVAGIAGTLPCTASADKLRLAIQLYLMVDEKESVMRHDLKKILNAINDVISFFGDPVVTPESCDMITFDAYNPLPSPSTPLAIDDAVTVVIGHPIVDILLSGQGKVRFTIK
jgi:hypothetical protein